MIRRALRERGWVEKEFKLPPRKVKEKGDSSDADDVDDDDDDGELFGNMTSLSLCS